MKNRNQIIIEQPEENSCLRHRQHGRRRTSWDHQ